MPTRTVDRLTLTASACVLLLFLVRVALALTSVPPWQNPDEPQHVMAVWLAGTGENSPDATARMERAVIESMARHRWWALVGAPTPSPLPSRFADDPELVERHVQPPRQDGLYYSVAARLARLDSPESALLSMRLLSLASGVGIVLLTYATGRALLGAWHGVGIAAVLSLQPQFVLVSTTGSADAFIGLLSSLMLWMVARSLASPNALLWLTGALVPVGAAILSRRLGFTVLPLAGWALMVAVATREWRRPERVSLLAIAVMVTGVVGIGWWHVELVQASVDEVAFWWARRPGHLDLWTGLAGLHRSAWLAAGWLRFAPDEFWIVTGGAILSCACAGTAILLAVSDSRRLRAALALGAGGAAIQVIALIGRQYAVGEVSQGRYLVPVAMPLAMLLWMGTVGTVKLRWQGLVAALLLLWLAAFDAASWGQVIWPAFS